MITLIRALMLLSLVAYLAVALISCTVLAALGKL